MTNTPSKVKKFRRVGILTVIAVYFLILVGGTVRSTGSGMGCPDWPKCFGSWVPPTDVSQLPEDYLDVYREKRIDKNKTLASYLDKAGFEKVSAYIFSHPSQYLETEFNATKTWIEYLNRIVGVVIGILVFLTLIYSIQYLQSDKTIFFLSLASFILVGFQGWLGSIVVSTNLLPVTVTIHMALALVLVALLQYAVVRSQVINGDLKYSKKVNAMIWVVLVTTFAQILLGTQVREEVDIIAFTLGDAARSKLIDQLGFTFYAHRSFTIVVLALHIYLAVMLYRLKERRMTNLTHAMLVILGAEIAFGIIMSYFAIPPFLQPLHLTFASLLFGVQFLILLIYYYASRRAVTKSVAVLN